MLLISTACFTGSAEYTIIPSSERPDDIPEELIDSSGADGTHTFWDLPLYFKLISIFCFLSFSSFGFFKFFPFLLGKIGFRRGEKNRKRILSYISNHPGCSEGDILKDLRMKRGTFRYHADKLKMANMLSSARFGRLTGYFRKGLCTEDEIISLNPYPENNTTTDVFEAILKEPGITNKDLSLKLGVDKSTISWHVSKLMDENFICFEKSGRFKRYYPNTNPRISPDQLT